MGNEIEYEAIVGMESVGKFKSFNEAFIKFFKGIQSYAEKNGLSYQWLETTNFLVRSDSGIVTGVIPYYEARDFAYMAGLLIGEGEIKEKVAEIAPDLVLKAYNEFTAKMVAAEFKALLATLNEILKATV